MTTDTGLNRARRQDRRLARRAALLAILGAAATGLLLPAGCSRPADKKGGPPPAVPVIAADAVLKDVPVTIRTIGTVEACNTVNLGARVGGTLLRVGFREGQNVGRGEMLFEIDPRPYEAALQSALADSARDVARVASASADEQRYSELVGKDYVTRQQYDAVKANAEAMRATLKADEAACANARLNLGFCTIRAPISGRTGNLFVDPGNLVKANDSNPLVTIQQIVPAYISFSVPEQRLPEIRGRQAAGTLRVQATESADTSRVFEGELTFVDNAVDRTTGMVQLKATFPNTDESLWPGQFMNVSLTLEMRKGAVVVPAPAVQKGQQGEFVYVIKPDQTVAMQPVVVGLAVDGLVAVERGLQVGDKVVTDGQLRLTPGARVSLKTSLDAGGAEPAGRRPGATAPRGAESGAKPESGRTPGGASTR
jgi:membrane fusion protein, multidrug efflux system